MLDGIYKERTLAMKRYNNGPFVSMLSKRDQSSNWSTPKFELD